MRRRRRPMGPTCTYRRVQRRRRGGQPLQQRTRLVGLHSLEVSIRRPDPPDAARGHPSTGRTERPSPLERRAGDDCTPNVRAQVGVAGEFGAEPFKKELHQRRQVRRGQTTWQRRGGHGPSNTVGASPAVTKIRAVPPKAARVAATDRICQGDGPGAGAAPSTGHAVGAPGPQMMRRTACAGNLRRERGRRGFCDGGARSRGAGSPRPVTDAGTAHGHALALPNAVTHDRSRAVRSSFMWKKASMYAVKTSQSSELVRVPFPARGDRPAVALRHQATLRRLRAPRHAHGSRRTCCPPATAPRCGGPRPTGRAAG